MNNLIVYSGYLITKNLSNLLSNILFFITLTQIYTMHLFMVLFLSCLQHLTVPCISLSCKLFVFWSHLMTFMRDVTTVWTHWYLQKSLTLNMFYELTTVFFLEDFLYVVKYYYLPIYRRRVSVAICLTLNSILIRLYVISKQTIWVRQVI